MAAARHAKRRSQRLRHLRRVGGTVDFSRFFAVDWSGAISGAKGKIWLCEVEGGKVRRLECGRDRAEVGAELVREAQRDPGFAVGIDFAFSLPAAFMTKRGHREIDDVWREVEIDGESWLAECPFPFWGKPGKKKPLIGTALYRRTELETMEATGFRPMSVFQIGGAGAVGVGSLRGMPVVRRLRREGFAVWPFDRAAHPLVIEIWPRVFMGPVRKSRAEERARFVAERYPDLATGPRRAAESSDDAFDALVSGLEMSRYWREIGSLAPPPNDPVTALEGKIWHPTR